MGIPAEIQPYILPAAVVAYFGWRMVRFKLVRKKLPALIQNGAVIVDVRSPAEFSAGADARSVNIPLGDLQRRAGELDPSRPLIVCCASGSRSAMAASILRRKGFQQVVNAGPWRNVAGV